MVQTNPIPPLVEETFHISPSAARAVLTVLTAIVILGGIKSIASVCERLVPFTAVFYILGCAVLLIANAREVPPAMSLILSGPFTRQAAVGGFLGAGVG